MRDAVDLARTALQSDACRSLFGDGVDPVGLLDTLNRGLTNLGSIGVGNIANAGTNAQTTGRLRPPTYVFNSDGTIGTRSNGIGGGADITISSNPEAAFNAGYGGRFGQTDAVNRAITVIHELAHAANYIYGNGSAKIFQNDSGPGKDILSRINSARVYNACFYKK